MKIVISEIPEEGLELELKDDIQSDIVRITAPVKSALRVDKVGEEVIVKGVLGTDVELECSRCLKHFPMRLSSQINIVYEPAKEAGRGEQHELKSDELDTVFYKGDTLDTNDLLREQLILNLPMKPLCTPGCKGFCAQCGADLNISGCGCESKEPDPRFEILKKLKKEKE